MLQYPHAHHLVDGVGRDGRQPLGVVGAKVEGGVRRILPGRGNHSGSEVNPDAPVDAIGEGPQVGAVATPHVEHDVGIGKLGVAVEEREATRKQRLGRAVPFGVVGRQVVKKRPEIRRRGGGGGGRKGGHGSKGSD